jgi:16S rRNA processing protein RimM
MTRLVLIARITAAHGVRGEVKIRSFTEVAKAFSSYGPLQTTSGEQVVILNSRPARDEFICTLKTVTDRNAAEALKGKNLYAARANLPAEPLLADFIGKPVSANSSVLGTISGFQNFGAGDLIELDNGLLIPLRFATLGDLTTVDLPDGFLDTDAEHAAPKGPRSS